MFFSPGFFTEPNISEVHPCSIHQDFIPFHGQTIFSCMDIPHFMDAFITDGCLCCFHFGGLVWIMLLWTFVYKSLCRCMLSVLLSRFLRVKLLGHMITLSLILWGTAKLFSKVAALFTLPSAMYEGSNFLTSFTLAISFLANYSHPVDMKW